MIRKFTIVLSLLLFISPFMNAQQTSEARTDPAAAVSQGPDGQPGDRLRLAISSEEYPVTPGDLYKLSYRQGDTANDMDILVESGSTISLGVFGKMDAVGVSFVTLKQAVERRILAGYPRSMPSLTITSIGLFRIAVRGEVQQSRYVTAWGLSRLSDIVESVRIPSTSLREVKVVAADNTAHTYDLVRALRLGQAAENPLVRSGESVILSPSAKRVELQGEVRQPGVYQLLPDEQLRALVNVYGGGISANAATARLRIEKSSAAGARIMYASFADPASPDTPLDDGDVVVVPANSATLPMVFFEGAVTSTPNPTTTGPAAAGSRESPAAVVRNPYNRVTYSFKQGEMLSDALHSLRESIAPLADLSAAVLIRDRGTSTAVDLRSLLSSSTPAADIPLQPNDRVVIPFLTFFTVSVQGAVFTPGNYAFQVGVPASYYVRLAGGIDPNRNSGGSITVYDSMGKERHRAQSEPLASGDWIYVPSTNLFYNLNNSAPVMLSVVTIVATVVSLFIALRP